MAAGKRRAIARGRSRCRTDIAERFPSSRRNTRAACVARKRRGRANRRCSARASRSSRPTGFAEPQARPAASGRPAHSPSPSEQASAPEPDRAAQLQERPGPHSRDGSAGADAGAAQRPCSRAVRARRLRRGPLRSSIPAKALRGTSAFRRMRERATHMARSPRSDSRDARVATTQGPLPRRGRCISRQPKHRMLVACFRSGVRPGLRWLDAPRGSAPWRPASECEPAAGPRSKARQWLAGSAARDWAAPKRLHRANA